MSEKIPGIIGGQGPYSTYLFVGKLLQYSEAKNDQGHIHYLLDNNPQIPSRNNAILHNGVSPVPQFIEMAKNLEKIGADFIVMPSNTSHAFYKDIATQVQIPFINMINVVSDAIPISDSSDTVVGILGTRGCLTAGLYQGALAKRGYHCVVPDEKDIQCLMDVIDSIKSGNDTAALSSAMREIAEHLINHGATSLVSACTEFPMVFRQDDVNIPLIDSLDVLARYTVSLSKGLQHYSS